MFCVETDYFETIIEKKNRRISIFSSQLETLTLDLSKTILGTGGGMAFSLADNLEIENLGSNKYSIAKNTIISKMTEFNELSLNNEGSKGTMGLHSAALISNEQIVAIRQDVGRHNAIDKICGWMRLNNIRIINPAILITGRISAEMVWKCLKMNIPMIISRTSATSKTVEVAREKESTLLGYVLTKRTVIYTRPERVG